MKTTQEIRSKLDQIISDERLSYEPANVFINAPLALIQVHLKAQADILHWVLAKRK